MKTLAHFGRLAALHALALPTVVLAQAQQGAPPGGVTNAWPLGLIVLLVALVSVLGMLVSRRGRERNP